MEASDGDGRRRIEKIGLAALAAVALAGGLYLGAALLLRSVLDSASLAAWAEPRMERSLSRDVEIGGVGLDLFPGLVVEVRDLTVASPEGMDVPPFAEVERVRLGVALWPLLRRSVEVDEVVVDGARVRLLALEDGRTTYGDLAPRTDEDREEGRERDAPVALEIRELRLENARVTWEDRAGGRTVDVLELSGTTALSRDAEGWAVSGRLRAGGVDAAGLPGVRKLDGEPAEVRLDGRAGPDFRRLEARSGSVRLGDVELRVSGRVDSLRSPVRLLDLRLRAESLPVEEATALLRPDTASAAGEAGGELDVDLEVSGPLGPDRRPDVSGLLGLRDGSWRDAGGDVLADGLEGEVALTTDSAVVRRLAGRLLGGPLEGTGTVRLDTARRFSARLRASPRLERWPGAAGEDGEASGVAELDLTVRGRAGRVASTRARGTVGLREVAVRRPGWASPVIFPAGTVELRGDSASATDLPVVTSGDTLRVTGRAGGVFSTLGRETARPGVDAVVRGPRLDLGALLPRGDDERASYTRLAFAHLAGGALDGRAPSELAAERDLSRPASLPFTGRLRLELGELHYGPWRLSEVVGTLDVGGDRLELRDAAFGVLGGRAAASMTMGLGAGAMQPFTLGLQVENAAGEELISRLTPVDRLLTGRTGLRIDLRGSLDTLMLPAAPGLTGEGRLSVDGGRLRENPVSAAVARNLSLPALASPAFDRFVVPFTLRGDSLRLASSTLRADSVSVDLSGVLGLGGRLDLGAALQLPRSTLSGLPVPRGAAGEAIRRMVGGGGEGPGRIGLRIGGTTARPDVRLDLSGLADEAAAPARKAREEVKEALEERARGILGRVLGGDRPAADSAAAPPDTAGGG